MNCGHKLVTILSICIILNIPEFGYSEDKNTFREILSDTSIVGLSHWDIAYDVFLVVVKSSVKEIKGEKIPSRFRSGTSTELI